MGDIDKEEAYASDRIPYVCTGCGASGIKLWRRYQSFSTTVRLLCTTCAEKDQNTRYDPGMNPYGIGWLVHAYPTQDGTDFWPGLSVPEELTKWWNDLPLR